MFIIFLAQFFSISIINYNSSATNTNRLRLGLLNILIFDTIISVYYEKKVTLETFDEKSGYTGQDHGRERGTETREIMSNYKTENLINYNWSKSNWIIVSHGGQESRWHKPFVPVSLNASEIIDTGYCDINSDAVALKMIMILCQ